jgi:hypothetical protein
MRLAIDTWAPSFGPAAAAGEDMQPASGPVEVHHEVHADDWAPRSHAATLAPLDDVRFVDGVRRIDARVWAWTEDDGGQPPRSRSAVAVSYGAGVVRSDGHATVEDCRVRRELLGPPGLPTVEAGSVRYTAVAVPDADDDTLVAEAGQRMRALEIGMLRGADDAQLTVVDGPLSGRQHVPSAVGYVKTHHIAYLPPVVEGVVPALRAGQRTPLFLTRTSWSRWSWYLRLPHGAEHPWAGVVRLEASAELGVEEAAALADRTCATLPRFASQPHRDPRAPQNLLPIAGLERALKRRLGDAALMERRLRRAAARLATSG